MAEALLQSFNPQDQGLACPSRDELATRAGLRVDTPECMTKRKHAIGNRFEFLKKEEF